MKSAGFLVAERPLARHCPELLARGAEAAALSAALGQLGERLAPALAARLAPLLGDDRAELACAAAEPVEPPVAAHCLIRMTAAPAAEPVLAWFDAASLLSLTDRVFGGAGAVPARVPERLPSAARLLLLRLADALAQALGEALGRPDAVERLDDSRSSPNLPAGGLLALPCTLRHGECPPWSFSLAMPPALAERLLLAGTAAPASAEALRPRGALDAPFAALPLPLTVTLAQLRLPVARLARLQPGDLLPFTMPREVGLQAGPVRLASGRVGTLDGHYALQLTPSANPAKGQEP